MAIFISKGNLQLLSKTATIPESGEIKMSPQELDHQILVRSLKKDGQEIAENLTGPQADAWHMSSCICGEAGELFDAIKKHIIYGKPLDIANVIEELRDLEFYLEGLRQILCITRMDTLQDNINKLNKRYSSGKFSNQEAQDRADKHE